MYAYGSEYFIHVRTHTRASTVFSYVVVIVDLNHGRVDAGSKTLDFDQSEHLVLGCLANLNS